MKKPKHSVVILKLRDLGCRHAVLWDITKDAAEYQVAHNKDMEQKLKAAEDYGPALRQQQYWHGIQWVLNTMKDFEDLQPSGTSAVLIRGLDPDAKVMGCKMPPKLKRAIAAFKKALKGN